MDEPTVHRASPGEWSLYREVRLAALEDAPAAFGSTLAEAMRLEEAEWRRRLGEAGCFLARSGQEAIGLAAGVGEATHVELVSMWVRPQHRGRGAADRLVEAVCEWAAAQGFTMVALWVAEGNLAAERLYARHGFRRTGETQPVRPDEPDRLEFRMMRPQP